ncbi:complement decay-accelerating factor, GPI-anchored isoform X2 [Hippocampus zosterae]|uniref:complement decay-accelerating factor, GPI-anchored isoform X2 n=1 Tax=Hippocampus zosterae TaxID=109293 RepID=UPI00223E73E9|nr:complement decay-accelerating factor, GPI-anchored isoform X2 [Hippocampus zosterae]
MEGFFLLGRSTNLKLTSLLFFCCCFVWRSEADCGRPQRGQNSVFTDQALLMDKFPEGSSVTLECSNGYEKEAGSEVITCQNDNWTQVELICKKRDCGVPKPQPNMIFDNTSGTLFGDVVHVTCEKGYEISGSSFKQCFFLGWLGKSECHIKTCKRPAEVSNGNNSWDSQDPPTYGQVILYNCDKGYTLIGNGSILCDETGQYDSPPPECKVLSATTMSSAAAHRDKIIRGGTEVTTRRDDTHTMTMAGEEGMAINVTSSPSSFFQETHDVVTDAKKDIDYLPVILSVVCGTLVVCIAVFCLYRCLLRRKGSYDTQEDMKSNFLLFQNL